MLTKYGRSNIIVMIGVGIILIFISLFLRPVWLSFTILFIGFLLITFTSYFFRDPVRHISEEAKNDPSLILAPADGKVIEIVEEMENVYLHKKSIRISIFLSPLDAHVNRSPISGVIKYFKYHPGKYLVAYHPKASSKNEQTHIGVENQCGKCFFKQIVGIVARRLVWDIKEGDSIEIGQKFGMMKFGSRMDIAIDTSSDILINIGDKVVAGETILAKLKCGN